jgi:hypothetical protein
MKYGSRIMFSGTFTQTRHSALLHFKNISDIHQHTENMFQVQFVGLMITVFQGQDIM